MQPDPRLRPDLGSVTCGPRTRFAAGSVCPGLTVLGALLRGSKGRGEGSGPAVLRARDDQSLYPRGLPPSGGLGLQAVCWRRACLPGERPSARARPPPPLSSSEALGPAAPPAPCRGVSSPSGLPLGAGGDTPSTLPPLPHAECPGLTCVGGPHTLARRPPFPGGSLCPHHRAGSALRSPPGNLPSPGNHLHTGGIPAAVGV